MEQLVWLFFFLNFIGFLLYKGYSKTFSFTIIYSTLVLSLFVDFIELPLFLLTLVATSAIGLVLTQHEWRYSMLEKAMKKLSKLIPKISETEDTALKAGTTWWDKELFSGKPNWDILLNFPKPTLTEEEQSFIDNEVQELCEMIDNFTQSEKLNDLHPQMWDHIKTNRFFGLIIPKDFNGHGFSALAHSVILSKIAGRSFSVASTVAVPNSLGPAELLLHYGTDEQKKYYLPRLAAGNEIPCFALTSPESGSDATSITDHGIVKKGMYEGKEVIGIELNWNKRYITLAPVATVLGLAFRLYDPESLIGDDADIGITCALIPTSHPGVNTGKRHKPLTSVFQNGPTSGENVFIPLDWIIGGQKMVGKGWQMLVECLSCGRAISLPSSATGAIKSLTLATGSYSRIRKQFKLPIIRFEGIQSSVAYMAGTSYLSEASSSLTAAAIDSGQKPSVIGAILKYQLTERGRICGSHAMDVHGGKAIMMGEGNYIADHYINTPVAITVEGANILTRSMIVYGQGALRCHPYILNMTRLLTEETSEDNVENFDKLMQQYAQSFIGNSFMSFWCSLSYGNVLRLKGGVYSNKYIRNVEWAASAFSVLSDTCLMVYSSKLKHKEMISARLADCLSSLYLASCCIKRFNDSNAKDKEKDISRWSIEQLLNEFWVSASEVINNLPYAIVKYKLKFALTPFGNPISKPCDKLTTKVAIATSKESFLRSLLSKNIDAKGEPIKSLESAFKLTLETYDIEKKLDEKLRNQIPLLNYEQWVRANFEEGNITDTESHRLIEAYQARMKIINVESY